MRNVSRTASKQNTHRQRTRFASIRAHEPSYVSRAIKLMLLLDRPVDPVIFFRYKDRSPSYRLCALFVPSSNHRGLDWKSVDTDADVGAMHSEWSIKRTDDRNLIQKIRISNRDRSNDSFLRSS